MKIPKRHPNARILAPGLGIEPSRGARTSAHATSATPRRPRRRGRARATTPLSNTAPSALSRWTSSRRRRRRRAARKSCSRHGRYDGPRNAPSATSAVETNYNSRSARPALHSNSSLFRRRLLAEAQRSLYCNDSRTCGHRAASCVRRTCVAAASQSVVQMRRMKYIRHRD